jgi:hypothetical protein
MHLKKGSSRWIKEQDKRYNAFDWQDGDGAFSVGLLQAADVAAYIKGQQEHHRVRSFKEEFREFLQRHGIAFDERYVWG